MEEIWKDIYFEENNKIIDYRGLYQISNLGRIKSLKRKYTTENRILKYHKNNSGYCYVDLCKNSETKRFLIHRLVAIHFIANPNNLSQVNHKNENKEDNCVENLEWCTHEYNQKYGTKSKRQSEKIKGRKASDDTKLKMSKSRSKKVIQYDLNGNIIKIWSSTKDICQNLNFKYNSFKYYLESKSKKEYYENFIWKYYNEDDIDG